MPKPLQIGITGGIGSGKSLVCKIFSCIGIPIYDADSHAKELMTTDGILIQQIKKEFGDLAYAADGTINRKYLSEAVFNDKPRLEHLNKLVHPRVAIHYGSWVSQHSKAKYVIKEAALLFESGSYKALDKVIAVSASDSIRLKRVLLRDKHRTEEQVHDIMEKQMSEDEKLNRADYIIYNDERSLLIPQVLALHTNFMSY